MGTLSKAKILRYLRFRHIARSLVFTVLDRTVFAFRTHKAVPNTLLIVRPDAIGDYLLFRNFIEIVKRSERFRSYQITLCGNMAWKELAEALDSDFIDHFIWIDRKRFGVSWSYRKGILSQVYQAGFDAVIYPNYSRELLYGDAIVRCSRARKRIGSVSSTSNDYALFTAISAAFYTKLIDMSDPHFEFDKSRLFFEKLLGESISLPAPRITRNVKKEKTVVLFPGAGEKARQWHPQHFAAVADQVHREYGCTIKICGSGQDKGLAKQIIDACAVAKPVDLTGKTSLVQLLDEIGKAALLITNESSALHMAVCVDSAFIALMSGKHYKRFAPYPNAPAHFHFVYPQPLSFYENLFNLYGEHGLDHVPSDVNEITPEQVLAIVRQTL